MGYYVGFNTINQHRKFTLTDFELVKRDLLNAFTIRPGEMPGRPGYGCTLLDLVFEPMTNDLVKSVEREVLRVAAQDPRIKISNIAVYTGRHSVVVDMSLTVLPDVGTEKIAMRFDEKSGSVSYTS